MNALEGYLAPLPLIAILRGVRPDEAVAIGGALVDAGFRAIEVPLNSPEPLASLAALAESFGQRALIGAGTVLDPADVDGIAEAGGRLIVMPHADPRIVRAAKARGLLCVPGAATPTEAFGALAAGADALKMFPAEALPPAAVKAWRAVLPKGVWLLPVGGITAERMAPYLSAGANGFGLGSALYQPGSRAPRSPGEPGASRPPMPTRARAVAAGRDDGCAAHRGRAPLRRAGCSNRGAAPQLPTLASTSAFRKRSISSMNPTEGTSRISAVIEAIW